MKMYRHILYKNKAQIYSSNSLPRLHAWQLADRLQDLREEKEEAKYKTEDRGQDKDFVQCLS